MKKQGGRMNIVTSRFGEIEVDSKEVITFSKGILGFNEYRKYVLLPADDKEKDTPFFFLQSTEKEDLCFFMLDTLSFFKEYDIEITADTIEVLNIDHVEDVHVLTIVTVVGSLKDSTTNLKAPVIINIREKLAKQVVLEKGDYLIKQPLFTQDTKSRSSIDKG
jgi:flagellar assembly factor FliW